MKVYSCIERFFCTPLKRYIPLGAIIYVYENTTKVAIKNAPDSGQDPFNTVISDYEYDEVDKISMFYDGGAALSHFTFIKTLPENEAGSGSGGVTKIVAGTNVTISPVSGVGEVTINASGGGGSGAVLEDLDFFEGNNPPYIADVDSYTFKDAAGFPVGQDTDVIFKVDKTITSFTSGLNLGITYALSTTETSKIIYLQLNYVVHLPGELYNGGTNYQQLYALPITATSDQIFTTNAFAVPVSQIPSNTAEIEFRLTRLGTNIIDTYLGDFGLKHIVIL